VRRSVLFGAAVAALVVVAVGVLVLGSRDGNDRRILTPGAVQKTFAARGVPVVADTGLIANPSVKVDDPVLLSNRESLDRGHGYLAVSVLRSLRDAQTLGALKPDGSIRDECGRALSRDLFTWRVKNVVVAYDACDITLRPYREAPASSYGVIRAVLGDLAS
jgi:hypothetical protein